jgi:hypothetical protein
MVGGYHIHLTVTTVEDLVSSVAYSSRVLSLEWGDPSLPPRFGPDL